MDSLIECDILGIREFALSRHFKVPHTINKLLSDISLSAVNTEHDDFLRLLADSKYSGDQVQQILSQNPLCYAFFQSEDGERKNMIIYTIDNTGKVTRWNTYYDHPFFEIKGIFDDFESQIPDLMEQGFVFISPEKSEFLSW